MVDIEYDRDLDTERRFRCVRCKKQICISECVSSRGHRMICWPCYLKYINIIKDICDEYKICFKVVLR